VRSIIRAVNRLKEGGNQVLSRVREEVAQGQTEYALLLMLIAMALIFVVTYFGGSLVGTYQGIITHLVF
jgi:Flp pilus assembly pilin Flp